MNLEPLKEAITNLTNLPEAPQKYKQRLYREWLTTKEELERNTSKEFIKLCKEQWIFLRQNLTKERLNIIRLRLCADGPLGVSKGKDPFLNIAFRDFWKNPPKVILEYIELDWEQARTEILLALILIDNDQ